MSSQTMVSPPHGVKRRAHEANIDQERRLSKRFDLLNLEQNGKLWAPAGALKHAAATPTQDRPNPPQTSDPPRGNDTMELDDTRDRTYIHNLDEELASLDVESEDDRLIFLPDIERKLGKIPKHILHGTDPPPSVLGTEMVLYSVPASLSVPVEQDSVRKAILESRARAKDEQHASPSRDALLHDTEDGMKDSSKTREALHEHHPAEETDPDAMEVG